MIDEELLNKFNRIQDLPVSEEMLGAYLEGKLDMYEMDSINDSIQENPLMQSIVEETPSFFSENFKNDVSIFDDQPLDIENNEVTHNLPCVNYSTAPEEVGYLDEVLDMNAGISSTDLNIDSIMDDPSFELPDLPFF